MDYIKAEPLTRGKTKSRTSCFTPLLREGDEKISQVQPSKGWV